MVVWGHGVWGPWLSGVMVSGGHDVWGSWLSGGHGCLGVMVITICRFSIYIYIKYSNSLATPMAAILVHNKIHKRLCTKMAAVSTANCDCLEARTHLSEGYSGNQGKKVPGQSQKEVIGQSLQPQALNQYKFFRISVLQ